MGGSIGAIPGWVFVAVSAVVGFAAGLWWGAAVLNAVAYVYLAYVLLMLLLTKPKNNLLLVSLGPLLRPTFNRYHLFIRFPGASTMYAGMMNVIRLALLVWAGLAVWQGHYGLAVASGAYFVITAFFVTRLDPLAHFHAAAARGNAVARLELANIDRARSLYESIMAIPR